MLLSKRMNYTPINHLANNLGGPMLYPEPHRITLDKIPQLAQFILKAMPTIDNYVKPNTTALVNYLVNMYGIMGVSAPQVSEVISPNNVELEEGPFDSQGAVLPSEQSSSTTLMPNREFREAELGRGSVEPANGTLSSSANNLFTRQPGTIPGNASPEFGSQGAVLPGTIEAEQTLMPNGESSEAE